jgi:hypothetical protein
LPPEFGPSNATTASAVARVVDIELDDLAGRGVAVIKVTPCEE